jgi:hypothetical protein
MRSLLFSLFLLGQSVSIPGASSGLVEASAGGSELPWFTPVLVSLLLLLIAAVYRFRHRPGSGPNDEETAPNGFEEWEAELENGYPDPWDRKHLLLRG